MKTGSDRRYTPEFRAAAVRQVMDGGRSVPAVARSLEMSPKTLANWVVRARKGQALVKREQVRPVTELEAQVSRLRQENAIEPVPFRRTPRSEKRYPRPAGSVACDEPETGRRWITRGCSRRYSLAE